MTEPTVVAELVCGNCGHHWVKRVPHPKVCPHCKHYDWDKSTWEVENEVKTTSEETNKKEETG